MNKMNKKGFTLIEMLVVIAIIAILVSIVIPVVGNSTERAKEAKDAANIRSAISEITAQGLATGTAQEKTVTLTQTGSFDQNSELKDGKIGTFDVSSFANKTSVTFEYNPATGIVSIKSST